MEWWHAQKRFWEAQAGLCLVRRDIYRLWARNCSLPPVKRNQWLQNLALYCRMQALSCENQGRYCQMLRQLLG